VLGGDASEVPHTHSIQSLQTSIKADAQVISEVFVCIIHMLPFHGKTRTLAASYCYVENVRMFGTAEEAMKFYGEKRTHDGKGVTIRSQRRYCMYFSKNLGEFARPLWLLRTVIDLISYSYTSFLFISHMLKSAPFEFLACHHS
jgi:hypothetical protein